MRLWLELWQVVGSYGRHHTADETRREEQDRISSGSQDTGKAQGGGSVIMQAGTSWGGGCCFSTTQDKMLKTLNKGLEARRSPGSYNIHPRVSRSTF